MKYGNKSTFKRIIYSPTALIILIIVFILLARSAWNLYQKAQTSSERLQLAKNELQTLQNRKDVLSTKITQLSNDEGLEAEIRTKYRAVKEGESVAVIIDESTTSTTTVKTSTSTVPWYKKIWPFF